MLGAHFVSEENSSGQLQRTYLGGYGDISGSNPSSGTYRYYAMDFLSSARAHYDGSGTLLASFEFDPYGGVYSTDGAAGDRLYATHGWSTTLSEYWSPSRLYSPEQMRLDNPRPLGYDRRAKSLWLRERKSRQQN